MTRTAPGINFSGGTSWGAYSQVEMTRWAQRSDISPRAVRVLLAAMGRHDRAGHARFARGELAMILGTVDEVTGEIVPASAQRVSDAVAVAKRLCFVTEDSTARCLVLSSVAFQKAQGTQAPCPVHGAARRRSSG